TIVIEAVAQLGIAANHLGRFDMNAGRTVESPAPVFGALGARYIDEPVLHMVHECYAARQPVTRHRSGDDNAIAGIHFQPVVVLAARFRRSSVARPDGRSPPRKCRARPSIRDDAVERPWGSARQIAQ